MNKTLFAAKSFVFLLMVSLQAIAVTALGLPGSSTILCLFVGLLAELIAEGSLKIVTRQRLYDLCFKHLDEHSARLMFALSVLILASLVAGVGMWIVYLVLPATLPKVAGVGTAMLCGLSVIFVKAFFSSLTNTPLDLVQWIRDGEAR